MALALDAAARARREAFVTGHGGSGAATTLAACLLLPAGVLLWRTLSSTPAGSSPRALPARVALELATVAAPTLLGCTLLSAHVWALLGAVLFTAHLSNRLVWPRTPTATAAAVSRRPTWVTNYRAGMLLATCLAILAVDFPVFPRAFAKTERFGESLMDLGVAGVLFAGGLTSRQARALAGCSDGRAAGWRPAAAARRLRGAAAAAVPLLALGAVKTLVHAVLNLPLHASEYGTSWNFFFTVAACTLSSAALELGVVTLLGAAAAAGRRLRAQLPGAQPAAQHDDDASPSHRRRRRVPPGVLGAAVAVAVAVSLCHQRALAAEVTWGRGAPAAAATAASSWGEGRSSSSSTLQSYILDAPRPSADSPSTLSPASFVAHNREGLFSVPGFLAVYALGTAIGVWVAAATMADDGGAVAGSADSRVRLLWRGAWGLAGMWAACGAARAAFGPVSRRLANAPYVAWSCAVCATVLWALLAVELCMPLPSVPPVPLVDAAGTVSPVAADALHAPQHAGGRSSTRRSTTPAAVHAASSSKPPSPDALSVGVPGAVSSIEPPDRIVIFDSINANFLFTFLLANLLTGAVNALVDTQHAPPLCALAILAGYLALVTGTTVALRQAGVVLKAW